MTLAFLLAVALILDAVLGEPQWLWSRFAHPAVLMGRLVSWLDTTLNNEPGQRAKGIVAVLVLGGVALAAGWVISLLGPVAQILAAAILIAQRSLVEHVMAVADALRRSLAEGRNEVSRIVSRDCRDISEPEIARAAIESASENLSDGVVAPAFWFLLAGLPGLVLYKAINTADSMIGYKNQRHARFGWAAARLDDVLNLVPARLTGLFIALLSHQLRNWPEIAADAHRHRSPNAGWPEAAMARALGIALAGPRSYDGQAQPLAWVNETAETIIGSEQIEQAVHILWRVWGLCLAITLAIASIGFLFLN